MPASLASRPYGSGDAPLKWWRTERLRQSAQDTRAAEAARQSAHIGSERAADTHASARCEHSQQTRASWRAGGGCSSNAVGPVGEGMNGVYRHTQTSRHTDTHSVCMQEIGLQPRTGAAAGSVRLGCLNQQRRQTGRQTHRQ